LGPSQSTYNSLHCSRLCCLQISFRTSLCHRIFKKSQNLLVGSPRIALIRISFCSWFI